MADGFDIVAVRVPDEGHEVALAVLRPQPRACSEFEAEYALVPELGLRRIEVASSGHDFGGPSSTAMMADAGVED